MEKFFKLLSKFILLPLLEKLGQWILKEYKQHKRNKEIKEQIKQDVKAMEDAKTKEQIMDAHRRNTNF
jgi:hypothetical protein